MRDGSSGAGSHPGARARTHAPQAILTGMGRARVDPFAVVAGLLAAAMLAVYVAVVRQQQGEPAPWALAALALGAVASGYGAVRAAPRRRVALALAAAVLLATGLLAILSIGLPILAAGVLALVAAARPAPAGPGPT